MVFFDVNMYRISENISQVSPREKENGQSNVELNSTDPKEKANMESLKKNAESENELYIRESQTIAKVLDKLLFILNILFMAIAFGYGFTTLYTN